MSSIELWPQTVVHGLMGGRPSDKRQNRNSRPKKLQVLYDQVNHLIWDELFLPLCKENFDEIHTIAQAFLYCNVARAEDIIDLDSLLSQMSESEEFHKIPYDFDYGTFLRTLPIKKEELHAQELVANVNDIFTSLCESELLQSTNVFVSVQWSKILSLIRQQVLENPTRKVKQKDFTCHFSDLHSLLVSDALEKEFGMLINIPVSMFSECHYHALTELIYSLNSIVLKCVVGQQFPILSDKACDIDVQNMSAEGKGKGRYCGAWAVARERYHCKEYFKSNIRSSDPGVGKKAKETSAKKELLEQLIRASFENHSLDFVQRNTRSTLFK